MILGFLSCQEPTRQPYLLRNTRGREQVRVAELVATPGEVTHLDEPELGQGFQAVIHCTQAHSDSLTKLALVEFRVLVQQAQNLEPRLVLDFRFVVQCLAGAFAYATATLVQPNGWSVAGGSFNLEQG